MRNSAHVALLGVVAALLLLGGPARGQSIYGPGGLFLNPTAAVPPKGQATPAILFIPQSSPELGGRKAWYSYTLDYGATERLEVGATLLKVTPGNPPFESASVGPFAKYQIVQGKVGGRPDIAVGGGFLTSGDVNATDVFVAARYTPRISPSHPVHLHAGVIYADRLNQFQRHNLLPYGGVDVTVSKNLILFAEMRAAATKPSGAEDVKPPSAVGVLWQPSPLLRIAVAYADNGWSSTHKLSVGVGYLIGTRR